MFVKTAQQWTHQSLNNQHCVCNTCHPSSAQRTLCWFLCHSTFPIVCFQMSHHLMCLKHRKCGCCTLDWHCITSPPPRLIQAEIGKWTQTVSTWHKELFYKNRLFSLFVSSAHQVSWVQLFYVWRLSSKSICSWICMLLQGSIFEDTGKFPVYMLLAGLWCVDNEDAMHDMTLRNSRVEMIFRRHSLRSAWHQQYFQEFLAEMKKLL